MSTQEGTLPRDDGSARRLDAILIALAAGTLLGLIWIAQGNMSRTPDNKPFAQPMHSPNDRSRFVTIRALVDRGSYAIGAINEDGSYTDGSLVKEPGWDTIDKVRRPDNGLLYSSKPPLMPTVLAGEYWLLSKIPTFSYSRAEGDEGWKETGRLTFDRHPLALVRIIVATANWAPFVIFLCLFARLVSGLTADPWVRAFTIAAAGFGTYLSGFSVTLNNHTVAAFAMFFSLYPALRIWCDGRQKWWLFAVSGFFAALAAVLELPATAFLAAVAAGLVFKSGARAVALFLPFALIPAAGHFYTTYLATGGLTPAYEKKEWYDFPKSYWKFDESRGRLVGGSRDEKTGELIVDPNGIDNQYEPAGVYVFHMLLGHHGVFSLTPIFVFSAIGVARVLRDRRHQLWAAALLAAGLTVVLLVFYTFLAGTRNYGGMTNGLRWLFWLIPLWLLFLPDGLAGRSSSRLWRAIALAALVISAASSFYASRNPWTRPWLQELLNQTGWIAY